MDKIRVEKDDPEILLSYDKLAKTRCIYNTLSKVGPSPFYINLAATVLSYPYLREKRKEYGLRGSYIFNPTLYNLIQSLFPFIERRKSSLYSKDLYAYYLSSFYPNRNRKKLNIFFKTEEKVNEIAKNKQRFERLLEFGKSLVKKYSHLHTRDGLLVPIVEPYYKGYDLDIINCITKYLHQGDVSTIILPYMGKNKPPAVDLFRKLFLAKIAELFDFWFESEKTVIYSMPLLFYLHLIGFDGKNFPNWVPTDIRDEIIKDINTPISEIRTYLYRFYDKKGDFEANTLLSKAFKRLFRKYLINVISEDDIYVVAITKFDMDIMKDTKITPFEIYKVELPLDLLPYEVVPYIGFKSFFIDEDPYEIVNPEYIPFTLVVGPNTFILSRSAAKRKDGFTPVSFGSLIRKVSAIAEQKWGENDR